MLLSVLLLPSLCLCQSSSRQAASPTQGTEQAFVFEQVATRRTCRSDGTGTSITEVRVRVLSAAGVQALGQLRLGYSAESEQLSIDYVRVRKPSGELVNTPVDKAPEVSLMISKDSPVYTDYREKHISVAALAPGDVLEYKVSTQVVKPMAANQFWLTYRFNHQDEVQAESLIVEAPKSRELKIKSRQPYATEETAATRVYTWKSSNVAKASNKKENDNAATEEEAGKPDVQLSTFQSWQDVAKWYEGLLADRIVASPEVKAKADEITKGAAGNEEKERRLYDFVSKSVRYVSLSFGMGRFRPHAASEVLHNEYGDCKDKHTLLAALLKAAGINTHAVLIHSRLDLDRDVPSPAQFDHLITSVESDGRQIWLDSTLGVAPFGLIPGPLRDKEALLIASDRSDPVVRTPESSPVNNSETFEVDGTFDGAGNLEAAFKASLQGDNALIIRAAARGTPQAQWRELVQNISYSAGFAGDVSEVRIDNVETPDLPLQLSYHYSRKLYFAADDREPLKGRNLLPFPPVALDSENISTLKKGQKFKLQGPLQVAQKARLKFTGDQHPMAPIPISVSRDYGSYASKYELKRNELIAERTYTITATSLPAAREKDLQSFLGAIAQDHGQQVTVKLSPQAVDTAAENSSDAVKLNDAARARLAAKDYTGAEKLLQKAVQADPQSDVAWNNLGLAYLGQDQYQEAEKAFRKQIEVNPFDHWAYNNLGRVLERENRDEEAITAYRKQIEIVPLDQYTHKNLGMILFRIQKFSEAVPELEAAAQITPDDSSVKFALAGVYRLTGQEDKASALVYKLPVGPSPFMGPDFYKATIHELDDPEATLRWGRESLEKVEKAFKFGDDDPKDRSATMVPALWGAMGWAYFRMDQMENAERYLYAAWTTSQSADLGSRLAQVYEKQNKKALAMQVYAKALSGEGSKEGIFAKLEALAGDQRKATAMTQGAGAKLSAERTVVLRRTATKPSSTELFLVFTHSSQPDKVLFRAGAPAFLDRYKSTIKGLKFSVAYPDQTPQRIVRQAILNCGLAGCAVVLMPISTSLPTSLLSPP